MIIFFQRNSLLQNKGDDVVFWMIWRDERMRWATEKFALSLSYRLSCMSHNWIEFLRLSWIPLGLVGLPGCSHFTQRILTWTSPRKISCMRNARKYYINKILRFATVTSTERRVVWRAISHFPVFSQNPSLRCWQWRDERFSWFLTSLLSCATGAIISCHLTNGGWTDCYWNSMLLQA